MNRLDLIIENMEYAKLVIEQAHKDELLDEALAVARSLRELNPKAWTHSDFDIAVLRKPQPTFPCDTCNAPNTQISIMFRCGTCYYQSGKMPTKYVPIDAVIAKAEGDEK
jgi:hypothetical protein